MARLTEEMVQGRTRQSNLSAVIKLNCWGSELQDVSLVSRLTNVETISLSVNKIRSLADFQHCKKLKHLFVRKNDIRDLNQICYLRDLPLLTNLWLAENPCASSPGYRKDVLRNLPRLEKLDDVAVSSEERLDAQRSGIVLPHPDDEDQPQPSHRPSQVKNEVVEDEPNHEESPDDEQEEKYEPTSSHYPPNDYEYSPEPTSSIHSNYMQNYGTIYNADEQMAQLQDNGFDGGSNYETDEDYVQHSGGYVAPTILPAHHRPSNQDLLADEEPPQILDDHDEIQQRAALCRPYMDTPPARASAFSTNICAACIDSKTRTTRSDGDIYRDIPRHKYHSHCHAELPPCHRLRQDMENSEPQSRNTLPRSRTMDMTICPHASNNTPLHERERSRQRPREVGCPARSLSRPRQNINVLSAVLCLIKDLELPDLEVVELNVKCRIEELLRI